MKFLGIDDPQVKLPKVRWIHVNDDGSELNYPFEPDNVPSPCVKITSQTSQWVDEETRTRDAENGDMKPPPGRGGWINAVRSGGSTRWIRRRPTGSVTPR
jgi:hypothetical protein